MVKGVSRQVIVMQSPDRQLFDQAIFILRDEVVSKGVTEEALISEPFWICVGAVLTGIIWLLTALI